MQPLFKILENLTTKGHNSDFQSLIKSFAQQTGWNPSYFFDKGGDSFANGHLVVEHGLENTAILTFLNKSFNELDINERKSLLNLSYNNLVDWHISIDRNVITFIYNRAQYDKQIVEEQRINLDTFENLRTEAFLQVIGKKPSQNTPALDAVLISTISEWKRKISSLLNNKIDNTALSGLFNTIIALRAYEDNLRRHGRITEEQIILGELQKFTEEDFSIINLFKNTVKALNHDRVPDYLIDFNLLTPFEALHQQDTYSLCKDFYINKVVNFYQYDFSIISKHALSRIYERYVSILSIEDTTQLGLFPGVPVEKKNNKDTGTYYTPQYLARFFSKYIKNKYTNTELRKLKIVEPAIGSGIFIRSLIELLIEEAIDERTSLLDVNPVFNNILGLDLDKNACHASKLSLALLYMLINDSFPKHIDITNTDSIKFLNDDDSFKNYFDVLISNPPFIKSDKKSTPERTERFAKYMKEDLSGKMDEYSLFIKTAIRILKPGGYGLFVLPMSFLINDSYKKLRKTVAENCSIKLLADLSLIPVFEDASVYVILLAFQKKNSTQSDSDDAVYLKASSNVGQALDDVLKNNFLEINSHSIYPIKQTTFDGDYWHILSKGEEALKQKIDSCISVDTYLDVKQGFVSGNDDVFIVDKIPKGEGAIYKPYIPDKDIYSYLHTYKPKRYFFYPFYNNSKISEKDLKKHFPETWSYLSSHKKKLSDRSLPKGTEWWCPIWPRTPEHILLPKIITPHLVLTPRFGIDLKGDLMVSHSPFFTLKDGFDDENLLLYFLGILNSTICFWFISIYSHKYGHNYNRLEKATLKHTKVPDPNAVSRKDFLSLIKLVQKRLNSDSKDVIKIENEIDLLVSKLYGLTEEETNALLLSNT